MGVEIVFSNVHFCFSSLDEKFKEFAVKAGDDDITIDLSNFSGTLHVTKNDNNSSLQKNSQAKTAVKKDSSTTTTINEVLYDEIHKKNKGLENTASPKSLARNAERVNEINQKVPIHEPSSISQQSRSLPPRPHTLGIRTDEVQGVKQMSKAEGERSKRGFLSRRPKRESEGLVTLQISTRSFGGLEKSSSSSASPTANTHDDTKHNQIKMSAHAPIKQEKAIAETPPAPQDSPAVHNRNIQQSKHHVQAETLVDHQSISPSVDHLNKQSSEDTTSNDEQITRNTKVHNKYSLIPGPASYPTVQRTIGYPLAVEKRLSPGNIMILLREMRAKLDNGDIKGCRDIYNAKASNGIFEQTELKKYDLAFSTALRKGYCLFTIRTGLNCLMEYFWNHTIMNNKLLYLEEDSMYPSVKRCIGYPVESGMYPCVQIATGYPRTPEANMYPMVQRLIGYPLAAEKRLSKEQISSGLHEMKSKLDEADIQTCRKVYESIAPNGLFEHTELQKFEGAFLSALTKGNSMFSIKMGLDSLIENFENGLAQQSRHSPRPASSRENKKPLDAHFDSIKAYINVGDIKSAQGVYASIPKGQFICDDPEVRKYEKAFSEVLLSGADTFSIKLALESLSISSQNDVQQGHTNRNLAHENGAEEKLLAPISGAVARTPASLSHVDLSTKTEIQDGALTRSRLSSTLQASSKQEMDQDSKSLPFKSVGGALAYPIEHAVDPSIEVLLDVKGGVPTDKVIATNDYNANDPSVELLLVRAQVGSVQEQNSKVGTSGYANKQKDSKVIPNAQYPSVERMVGYPVQESSYPSVKATLYPVEKAMYSAVESAIGYPVKDTEEALYPSVQRNLGYPVEKAMYSGVQGVTGYPITEIEYPSVARIIGYPVERAMYTEVQNMIGYPVKRIADPAVKRNIKYPIETAIHTEVKRVNGYPVDQTTCASAESNAGYPVKRIPKDSDEISRTTKLMGSVYATGLRSKPGDTSMEVSKVAERQSEQIEFAEFPANAGQVTRLEVNSREEKRRNNREFETLEEQIRKRKIALSRSDATSTRPPTTGDEPSDHPDAAEKDRPPPDIQLLNGEKNCIEQPDLNKLNQGDNIFLSQANSKLKAEKEEVKPFTSSPNKSKNVRKDSIIAKLNKGGGVKAKLALFQNSKK